MRDGVRGGRGGRGSGRCEREVGEGVGGGRER